MPGAGINDRDKQLHPTVSLGCNYLFMPMKPGIYMLVLNSSPVMINFDIIRYTIQQINDGGRVKPGVPFHERGLN